MIASQPWFDRKFTFDLPSSRFPDIIERLRGTPARIEERVRSFKPALLTLRFNNTWSIQENIGHLGDLEPIWIQRSEQIISGETELAVADLSNHVTDEANHNSNSIHDLLIMFRNLRFRLVSILEAADGQALEYSARHPRLGTKMRLIDIAFFTAEHDDHHLARISVLSHLLQI